MHVEFEFQSYISNKMLTSSFYLLMVNNFAQIHSSVIRVVLTE